MSGEALFVMFVTWVLLGPVLSGIIASSRGRSAILWGILGALFPLFALILVLALPSEHGNANLKNADYSYGDASDQIASFSTQDFKICPECAEQIKAAARICRYCRYEFGHVDERLEADVASLAFQSEATASNSMPAPEKRAIAATPTIESEKGKSGIIWIAVIVIVSSAALSIKYKLSSDEVVKYTRGANFLEITMAQHAVKSRLKDPDSAIFSNIVVNPDKTICGYVNAKNMMGGYTGPTQFQVVGDTAFAVGDDGGGSESLVTKWCRDSFVSEETAKKHSPAVASPVAPKSEPVQNSIQESRPIIYSRFESIAPAVKEKIAINASAKGFGKLTLGQTVLVNPDGSLCGIFKSNVVQSLADDVFYFVVQKDGAVITDSIVDGFHRYYGRESCRQHYSQPVGVDLFREMAARPFDR